MENRFEIKVYPKFDEVFTDDKLKGIFYPLCSVVDKEKHKNKIFHFVSSNGLWMNENFGTDSNTDEYTLFELKNDKYVFNGNLDLYTGSEHAKLIFPILENDFEINGESYLSNKIKTEEYIDKQKQSLPNNFDEDFDIDYYVGTFYEFSINRLNYKLNGGFGEFRKIIDGWGSHESPIVYDETTDELAGSLNHYNKPKIGDFDNFEVIGKILGSEFFTDGNDTILFYNKMNEKIVCVNFYS